jgi:hypothetical protein
VRCLPFRRAYGDVQLTTALKSQRMRVEIIYLLVSKVKVNLSVCLTNKALRHEGVWRADVHPHFLEFGLAGGEWSASRLCRFTPVGKSPRYPLDRRLSGPQSRSGRQGQEKIFDPTGTRTSTSLSSSLLYMGCHVNVFVFQTVIQETWLPSRCLAMGVCGYATSLTIRYLGSVVSLRSGFNCHNVGISITQVK